VKERSRQKRARIDRLREMRFTLDDTGYLILDAPEFPPKLRQAVKNTGAGKKTTPLLSFSQYGAQDGYVDQARRSQHLPIPNSQTALNEYGSQIEGCLQELGLRGSLWVEFTQALYTVYPTLLPQLFHTDHPLIATTKGSVYSVIVAGNRAFHLLHSRTLWNAVKSRGSKQPSLSQDDLLRHDVQHLRIPLGKMIIFRGDWPHAGDVDARNYRLFFAYGELMARTQGTNQVHSNALLNHATVLKMHHEYAKYTAEVKVAPKDASFEKDSETNDDEAK
jgi:hypothetical protein